jgi:hypothetical protein
LFEDLLLKAKKKKKKKKGKKGGKKWEIFLTLKSAIMGEIEGFF